MNLFAKLKQVFGQSICGPSSVRAPSPEFPKQADAMAHVIRQIRSEGWATFEASDGKRDIIVQVTPDSVNTCREEVDIPGIARKIGLSALAQAIEDEGITDRTAHRLPGASAEEIAEIVHGVFLHHYGLPQDYGVDCSLDD